MKHRMRKYYLAIALIAAVAVTGIVCHTPPAESQLGTYFYDQFNLGGYDWTPVRGSWTVANGEYTEIIDPSSDEAWSVAGSSSWFDYAVETKVYSTDSDGTISLAGRWANENNYYALEYSDTGTPDSAKLMLYKRVNGLRVDLAEWKRVNGAVYNYNIPFIGENAAEVSQNPYPVGMKLKFLGANIDVYVNDVRIGYTSDSSLYYGKIALGEYNRKAYFDEIYVWDVTPPRLITNAVQEVVGNAAAVSFSTDEYSSYAVNYKVYTSPTWDFSKGSTVRALSHSVDLTGLTTDTTYFYMITVKDAAGNEKSSEIGEFTTPVDLDSTPPVISDVVYSDVTANSAVISWTTDDSANSTVEYGVSPGSYKWAISYDDKVTSHSISLKKLSGQTTYYVRVKSRDLSNNMAVSGEYSFTTLKDLKPRITKVATGSSPSVNVAVYWEQVPAAVRYHVYVSTSNQWGAVPDYTVAETGADKYSYMKPGLTSYLNYFIKVVAEDGTDTAYTVAKAFPPDANPHGYYWDNPDLCQNCHVTHSALGPRLITEVNTDRLCITCHDGTQSKYDVLRGKYRGPESLDVSEDPDRSTWYASIGGPYGSFETQTVIEEAYVPTSRHDLNIYHYAATGNNIEVFDTAESRLSCASCHDPHGSENYRSLRENMRVSNDPTEPLIKTEAYAVTYAAYEKTTYVSGAVEFCGACHSDFNQGAGSSRTALTTTQQPGMKLSTSSMHMFMHPVNIEAKYVTNADVAIPASVYLPYENGKIICQTCHFSHGTTMEGTHIRRDGFPSTVLKRFNEDDGCEDCHDKTRYPDE